MQERKQKTILLTKEQHRQIEESSKSRLQAFQRKIYLKAKQNPQYKFYCLYDKVHRKDVMREAYKRVKQNKGAPGIDKQSFQDLEGKEEEFLKGIRQELIQETYTPGKLREVQIPKGKGKTRTLKIPTIRDRVVQMAIKLIIEPIFEADFQENSYGYRPKKDAHQAIRKLNTEIFPDIYRPKEKQKEICSIDLTNCFDTIPHRELIQLVARRIIDRRLLRMIKEILKSGAMEETRKGQDGKGEGTPQGGVLSPLMANIYLDQLDRYWAEKEVKSKMLRYADDMIVLLNKGEEKEYERFLEEIEERYKLVVNREKSSRRSLKEGFDFLGFTIREKTSRNQKQYMSMEPSRKSLTKIKEKLRREIKWNRREGTEEMIEKTNRIVRGWQQYFDNIGMGKTRQHVKRFVEERVAKMISRRKKRSQITWKFFREKALYTKYRLYELKNLGRIFAER